MEWYELTSSIVGHLLRITLLIMSIVLGWLDDVPSFR
jgi:hypothetical protein